MAKLMATLTTALTLLTLMDNACAGSYLEQEEENAPTERISMEELNRIHSKCDNNGDGKASLPELMLFGEIVRKRIAEKEIGSVMNEIDTAPKDGHASLQEYMDDLEQHHAIDEDSDAANKHIDMRNVEMQKFQIADADANGSLNVTELINMVSPGMHDKIFELSTIAELEQKDTDGDGMLNEDEFWEGTPGQEGEFQKLDKDGDGKIDLEELKMWASGWYHTEAALQQLFDIADADKDGLLDRNELETVYTTIDSTDAHYHLLQWASNDGEPPENSMVFEEEAPLIEEGEL